MTGEVTAKEIENAAENAEPLEAPFTAVLLKVFPSPARRQWTSGWAQGSYLWPFPCPRGDRSKRQVRTGHMSPAGGSAMSLIRLFVAMCVGGLIAAIVVALPAYADKVDVEEILLQPVDIGADFVVEQSGDVTPEVLYPGSGFAPDFLRRFVVGGYMRVFRQGNRRVGVRIIEFTTHQVAGDQAAKGKSEKRTASGVEASARRATKAGEKKLDLAAAKGRMSVEVFVVNQEPSFSSTDERLAERVLTVELARVPALNDLPMGSFKSISRQLAWHTGIGTGTAIIAFAALGELAGVLRSQGEREWAIAKYFRPRPLQIEAERHDLTPSVRRTLRQRMFGKVALVLTFATLLTGVIVWPGMRLRLGLLYAALVVTFGGIAVAMAQQSRMGSRSAHGRGAAVIVGLGVAGSGLMIGVGAALLATAAGLVAMVHEQSLTGMGQTLSFALLGSMIMTKSRWPIGFAHRLLQPVVRARLEEDERRPIVLLRSFQDDSLKVRTPNTQLVGLETLAGESYSRFEEIIAWRAWRTGPVLAIGQPGTVLQPLGAARDYFSDDEWQAAVDQRAADARAIVMVVGRSPGLVWEVRKILSEGHLAKTVFVLPPVASYETRARIQVLCMALGLDWHLLMPGGGTHVVAFFFHPDGRPVIETCAGRPGQAYAAALDHALACIGEAPGKLSEPEPRVRAAYRETLDRWLVTFDPSTVKKPRTNLTTRLYFLVWFGLVVAAIFASATTWRPL